MAVPGGAAAHVGPTPGPRSCGSPPSAPLTCACSSAWHRAGLSAASSDDGFDSLFAQALNAGSAGRFMLQPDHPGFGKPAAPQKHRGSRGAQVARDMAVGQTAVGQKANAGAEHNLLRSGRSAKPASNWCCCSSDIGR